MFLDPRWHDDGRDDLEDLPQVLEGANREPQEGRDTADMRATVPCRPRRFVQPCRQARFLLTLLDCDARVL